MEERMRGRAGLFVVGGALAAAGALVASPNTYTWIRRKAGLEQDEQYELDRPLEEDAGEPPIDLREARLSLRARLAEHQELTDEHEFPGRDEPGPLDPGAADPLRAEAESARDRLRASARDASRRFGS
jgi:hypothetical protein